ncbi:MAG: 4a-hydroxytetrahydrobiopterin dehydratase [Caulobacteraceae bacterium]|nr:4a-hydroxytetrahydrobiopterin dehydratase [Caulobacteraceae bacterium]
MTNRDLIGAKAALEHLPDWRAVEGRDAIARSLRFADFSAAMRFMAEVARTAELLDHHPEWSNVYNRVEVLLSTHSEGGVTGMDLALARAIDKAATSLSVGSTPN